MVSETELIAHQKKLVGRRVRVTGIMDDDWPLPIGDEGIVTSVDDAGTLSVKWESGRLIGVLPGDPWELLPVVKYEYAYGERLVSGAGYKVYRTYQTLKAFLGAGYTFKGLRRVVGEWEPVGQDGNPR